LLPRLGRCLCHAAAAATPRRGWLTGCRAAPRRFYNPNGDYDDADKEELVEECKASGEEVVRSASPASRSRRGARAPPDTSGCALAAYTRAADHREVLVSRASQG
jgi:hypothetical protein